MTAPGLGRTVLVVEDAAEVRLLLTVLLEASGFVVHQAADGPEGVRRAALDVPDVVLLDVQLPGLDGPDVLRTLRSQPETSQVPVVFLTAAPAVHDGDLLRSGALGVLRKPFDASTIGDELAALL